MNSTSIRGLAFIALAPLAGGCGWGERTHPVIEAYLAAECVTPVLMVANGQTEWTWRIGLSGEEVMMRSPTSAIAGKTGSARYPRAVDVRLSRQRDRFFVKMGTDGFLFFRTVTIYEHDRTGQRGAVAVDPAVLPADCQPDDRPHE